MPRGYARYVLAIMVAINFLNFADRWVASAAAPLIQAEFHLDDFRVGLLGTAFLLVYGVAAIPFGIWADRGVRKVVVGVGVLLWSCATVVSGLVLNYGQLLASRTFLGVGEAGYYPAGNSLLGDYFPKESRGRAMSIWNAGSALGIAVGFAGGGFVASTYGWRAAFFFAAVPGLVLALAAFTLREPLRGAAERMGPKLQETRQATLAGFRELARIRTLRATILARTVLFFVLASAAYWLPTVLGRRFGLSVGAAGLLSGAVLVLGALAGTLLGGWAADRGRHRRLGERAPLVVGIAGFVGGAVLMPVALLAPLQAGPVPIFVPAFFLTVVAVYLYAGPYDAITQNVVSPALRASAMTLTLLVAHLFGDSYAPAAVGLLSDRLGSLPLALLVTSVPLLLLAAAVAATGLGSIGRDAVEMEERWAAKAVEREGGWPPN